jgi:hypothetical protein
MAAKGQKFSFGRLINNAFPNFAKDDVRAFYFEYFIFVPQVSLYLPKGFDPRSSKSRSPKCSPVAVEDAELTA